MTNVVPNLDLLKALSGRTAIITGGAGGIGAETVRLFHEYGAKVVIADLSFAEKAAGELISSLSSRVIFVPTDILDWSSMLSLFAQTKQKFGSVEFVVANAGLMETKHFFDMEVDEKGELKEPKEAYKVIDVNLKGTMNTLRLAMHNMSKNRPNLPDGSRGSVILVSSTSGYFGGTSVVSYVSSKHGVMGLLRASQKAAKENGVRINAVAPFFTPTHITSNYAKAWRDEGLLENTAADVARAIAQTACDPELKGKCCLAAGKLVKECEGPMAKLIPTWFGDDIVEQMTKGAKFFEGQGGYPLPPPRS